MLGLATCINRFPRTRNIVNAFQLTLETDAISDILQARGRRVKHGQRSHNDIA